MAILQSSCYTLGSVIITLCGDAMPEYNVYEWVQIMRFIEIRFTRRILIEPASIFSQYSEVYPVNLKDLMLINYFYLQCSQPCCETCCTRICNLSFVRYNLVFYRGNFFQTVEESLRERLTFGKYVQSSLPTTGPTSTGVSGKDISQS